MIELQNTIRDIVIPSRDFEVTVSCDARSVRQKNQNDPKWIGLAGFMGFFGNVDLFQVSRDEFPNQDIRGVFRYECQLSKTKGIIKIDLKKGSYYEAQESNKKNLIFEGKGKEITFLTLARPERINRY